MKKNEISSCLKFGLLGMLLISMVSTTNAQVPKKERQEISLTAEQQAALDNAKHALPLYIVEYDGSQATMDKISEVLDGSGIIRHRYQTIPYIAILVSMPNSDNWVSSYLESMDGVMNVGKDSYHTLSLAESLAQTQALQAQQDGFDGSGCSIAVLDTGIDDRHCMFAGKLTKGSACFGTDFVQGVFSGFEFGYRSLCARGETSLVDGTLANTYEQVQFFPDHGTHVAGIAAGGSCEVLDLEASAFNIAPGGVASGADIIPVNVFSDRYWNALGSLADPANSGTLDQSGAFTSDIIAGLEFVFVNRDELDVCAVNMSLGGGAPQATPCADATEMIIDMLTEEGVAVVIASGNGGSRAGVGSPACVASAIAVGAVDDTGDIAGFSDHLDSMVDLMAPGVGINSATSDFTTLNRPTVSFTWNASGTSMATPHVAGAFAILKARFPTASVEQILVSLQETGAEVPGFDTPAILISDAITHLSFAIPTMGQWSLFILALLLTSLGLVFVRRKMLA